MLIYEEFPYTGHSQRWSVPKGVTTAFFECWGAAGGMPSSNAYEGKVGQTRGGSGDRNIGFDNHPLHDSALGRSYANNSGYAAGVKPVKEGESYFIFVGGNGGPGLSTIRLRSNGSRTVRVRGGSGGFNGGGSGGAGAHVFQNLYNSTSTRVKYKRNAMPNSAKVGQLWLDTGSNTVYRCKKKYSGGGSLGGNWSRVTDPHKHMVGSSGGGGGGATDIRLNGDDVSNRILVAGGGGGAGGHWSRTGSDAWQLRATPETPAPPFGADTEGTGPTGIDNTWASRINYFVGGWGRGGLGGASGPEAGSKTTTDAGVATVGEAGGPASNRHQEGHSPGAVPNSGGKGGSEELGGAAGSGGGAQAGALADGGNGASADGGDDDFCAGGGGGGGGFYGGGGGGHGFKVTGSSFTRSARATHGGGGGGGSNYVSPDFTSHVLIGGARPPAGANNKGTGANGAGGFARISYRLQPLVQLEEAPNVADAGAPFSMDFTYSPAKDDGAGIAFYMVGHAADPNATFPTTQSTVVVRDHTLTSFTYAAFTAPADGVTEAFFVKVIDTDGDASDWAKQKVSGLTPQVAATITSPAADSQFIDTATVQWSLGTQSPLVAYRLGLSGTDLVGGVNKDFPTVWRQGGSRVNLATDPGFKGGVWSAGVTDATFPGVSGSNWKFDWGVVEDNSAEGHTTTWDNLIPGRQYRLHVEVASALANDTRLHEFLIYDEEGLLTTWTVGLDAYAAGEYMPLDIFFTPHTQGVYLKVVPSATGEDVEYLNSDFEDGLTTGYTAVSTATISASTAEANSGDYSLGVLGPKGDTAAAATYDLSTVLPVNGGNFMVEAVCFAPAGSDTDVKVATSGTGITRNLIGTRTERDEWVTVRVPFTWDGVGTASLDFYTGNASATTNYYDDIRVFSVNPTSPDFGNTDTGQITYLKDMVLELAYKSEAIFEEDFEDGFANWTALNTATLHSSAEFFDGSQSLGITVGASNDGAETVTDIPVTPGLEYEAAMQVLAGTISEDAQVGIQWRDSGGAAVGTAVFGTATTVPLLDWVQVTYRGVAPATAVKAEIRVRFPGASAADEFSIDSATLTTGFPGTYFDGSNLNGNTGTASWRGTVNGSASLLTGTDVTEGLLTVEDTRLLNGSLYLDTLNDDAIVLGSESVRANIDVLVNPSIPSTPTAALEVNSVLGLMRLTLDAADGANSVKTTYFDIYRNGVRIVTRLVPDPTTRIALYDDVPAHMEAATYLIRAFDADGGYTDQTDGTVTTV